MDQSDNQQEIMFDRSGIDACIDYLKSQTDQNLERLVFADGNKLAYRHHMWSSIGSRSTISDFWKKDLERIVWSGQLETSIEAAIDYLMSRRKSQWLNEVLGYLPKGHVFKTAVYLIGGYDNVVYGEDIALNLGFKQFHADHREVVYHLIHELAHAGYFKYHRMPDLARISTVGDLSDVVKLLTHLEGMGVISPFRLRIKEGGLLDDDYKVLLNEAERDRRIHDCFAVLSELDSAAVLRNRLSYGAEDRGRMRNRDATRPSEERTCRILQSIRRGGGSAITLILPFIDLHVLLRQTCYKKRLFGKHHYADKGSTEPKRRILGPNPLGVGTEGLEPKQFQV